MWLGVSDDESKKALHEALDQGVTFIDTALAYGDGHSEALLGRLVRANPTTKLYTATKIPPKNRAWPRRIMNCRNSGWNTTTSRIAARPRKRS